MKILYLHMIAYGPFTGLSLDLAAGAQGLHLVYGPNEAGKSAAMRGLKALLFGIEERTSDNFLHENPRLRVGGRLRRSDGSEIDIVRRKGRSKTLLAPDDTVLDDRILEAFLGGVGADAYSRMFGLGHEELARGGKDIADGKGDVGESLFAAAIGGYGIRTILEPLETEAARYFGQGKPAKLVKGWLAEYQQTAKEAREASLPGRDWEEHTRLLRETRESGNHLSDELRLRSARLGRIERIQSALPYLSRRKELQKRRAEMGEALLLPAGFSEKRRLNGESLGRSKEARERTVNKLGELESGIQAIRLPEELMEEAGAITRLQQLMGAYTKAMQDIPKRTGEAEQLEAAAAAVLEEIHPEAVTGITETLRLSLARKQSIRELGGRYEALVQVLQRSTRSAEKLHKKLAKARADLAQSKDYRDPRPLKDALKRAQRSGDLQAALSKLSSALGTETERAAAELSRLRLWQEDLEALEKAPVPSDESVTRVETAFGELRQKLGNLMQALSGLQADESELTEKIKSLELTRPVPVEFDLEKARERRQAGWKLVRAAWLDGLEEPPGIESFAGGTPLDEAYETSVQAADEIADHLRMEADRVAQHAAWIAQRDRTREQLERTRGEIQNLAAEEELLREEWKNLWLAAGIDPLPPGEMRDWIRKQRPLVQRAENIRSLHNEIRNHEARIAELEREILSAIEPTGLPQPGADLTLNALVDHGQGLVETIEEANSAQRKLESNIRELENELADADEESREAEAKLRAWQDQWAEAVKELGLAVTDSPATAGLLLDKIQQFVENSDKAVALRKRIEAMERDAGSFAGEVRELAGRVAPELQDRPPDLAVQELAERLAQGRADQATLRQLEEQRREQQRFLAGAEEQIRAAHEELEKLCATAGCRAPEDLDEIERRSDQARQIDDDFEAVSSQLLAFAGGGTVEDLVAEAEKIDPDALPGEIARLREEREGIERDLSAAEQTIGRETAELNRMDGGSRAADAAEKAQSFLAQVRASLERYLNLRLAAIILRAEVEKYRAAHEGQVLKRASDIFGTLTTGSFAGLRTEYDADDRPFLVGARASGEKVGVEGMSDGTCDQLYLSLRLASLENHLETHEPMPFVIDDILVNFDDSRAAATFGVLAELSRKTQVIFFTHHKHLVGLAERSAPAGVIQIHSI